MGLFAAQRFSKLLKTTMRRVSNTCSSTWTSSRVRETFITYFCQEHGHRFVLSSSTVPRSKDEGTYFTNAGMNQFKPIFLGTVSPDSEMATYRRVVNSQKCVRVGGKHNDLQDVGRDSYHNTFFEMLGNWSFADYFKREICEMSWRLLTEVYGIPRDRLYVTYFSGSQEWGLEPDLECRDIWRELGLADERILPFGSKDNFWAMGERGPCGPCSEIHYDHHGNRDAGRLVNAGCSSVTELWNLVFMQYDRQGDGSLRRLPQNHVDTGMSLERLAAVLQGKASNYDTDLFMPIIHATQQLSGAAPYANTYSTGSDTAVCDDVTRDVDDVTRDTAYRTVADHIRMVCVVVADGLLPGKQDLGHKLRQIMFRCYHQAYTVLKAPPGTVVQLVDHVMASLGGFYPELRQNYSKIKTVIAQTEQQYFEQARRRPIVHGASNVKAPVAEKPRITMPILDQYTVQKLKDRAVPETDDCPKYTYSKSQSDIYEFPAVESRLSAILLSDDIVDHVTDHVTNEQLVGLLVEKTNFYAQAGGQLSDQGTIATESGAEFVVERVTSLQNYVLHIGRLTTGSLRTGDTVRLRINQERRLGCMRNHTATHILHSALKSAVSDVVIQQGSMVGPEHLTFDFNFMGKLTPDHIERTQKSVNALVAKNLPVQRSQMALLDAERLPGLVKMEGESYPNVVSVVRIGDDISTELCGGTHVTNTSDLVAIVITNVSGVSQGTKRITAISGQAAQMALENCERLKEHVDHLAEDIKTRIRSDHWNQRFKEIDRAFSTQTLPRVEKDRIYKEFDFLRYKAAEYLNKLDRDRWKKEIWSAVSATPSDQQAVVECDFSDHKQMVKAVTKLSLTRPVAVHGPRQAPWTCVAYVPKNYQFTASDWLKHSFREVTSSRHVTSKNGQFHTALTKQDCDYDSVMEKLKNFSGS